MTQANLMNSAKQGNPQAIAAMINQSLQPKGITVSVVKSGSCLTIKAKSQAVPEKVALVSFLKNGITKLKPETIARVVVQGYAAEQSKAEWLDSFNLEPLEEQEEIHVSENSTTVNPHNSPKDSTNATLPKQTFSKPKTPISNSTPQSNITKPLANFAKTRNGERILIVASTFVITSALWLSVNALKANKNSPNVALSSPSPSPTVTTPSESVNSPTPQLSPSNLPAPTEDEKATKFVTAYLEKIVSGEDGDGFFCSNKNTVKFFAPRNFQILKAKMYDTVGQAIVRLDSSNKGGSQITSNWKFYLKKGEPQYAALIGDAGKDGMCLNLVTEDN